MDFRGLPFFLDTIQILASIVSDHMTLTHASVPTRKIIQKADSETRRLMMIITQSYEKDSQALKALKNAPGCVCSETDIYDTNHARQALVWQDCLLSLCYGRPSTATEVPPQLPGGRVDRIEGSGRTGYRECLWLLSNLTSCIWGRFQQSSKAKSNSETVLNEMRTSNFWSALLQDRIPIGTISPPQMQPPRLDSEAVGDQSRSKSLDEAKQLSHPLWHALLEIRRVATLIHV